MTAAALLFTAIAASAPVSVQMSCSQWEWREPRAIASVSYSSVEYPFATSFTACTAAGARTLRPRLVWMMTPLAFTTRRREGRFSARSLMRVARTMLGMDVSASLPARIACRASSMLARTASHTKSRGALSVRASSEASWRTSST